MKRHYHGNATKREELFDYRRRSGGRLSGDSIFSYSHVDEDLRDQLETHLAGLQRQGLISSWHDRRIAAGKISERPSTVTSTLQM